MGEQAKVKVRVREGVILYRDRRSYEAGEVLSLDAKEAATLDDQGLIEKEKRTTKKR